MREAVSNRGVQPNQAWLTANGGVPIKEALVDNSTVGDYYCRVRQFISVNPASGPVAIRTPSGRNPTFFFYTTNSGAIVYQTDADKAASTPSSFVCRANISTLATILVA